MHKMQLYVGPSPTGQELQILGRNEFIRAQFGGRIDLDAAYA